MFCGQCGKEVEQPLARFCAGCGAAVGKGASKEAPDPRELPDDLKQDSTTAPFRNEQPQQFSETEDTHSKLDPIGPPDQKTTSENSPREQVTGSDLPKPEGNKKPAGIGLWLGAAVAMAVLAAAGLHYYSPSGGGQPTIESKENAYVNPMQQNLREGPAPEYKAVTKPDPEEVPGNHGLERQENENRHSDVRQMLSSSLDSNEAAIQEARKAIEQLPPFSRGDRKTARAGNDQGIRHLKAGQFSEAINVLERAHQADLGDIEIVNNLGYAYFMHGDLETAEQNLLTTLSLEPGRAAAWTNLGQTYAKKGDEQSAAGCFANAYRFSKNRLKTRDFLIHLTQEGDSAVLRNSVQQATQFAENHFLELSQAEKMDRPSKRKKMNTDDEKFWNDFSEKAERFQNQ